LILDYNSQNIFEIQKKEIIKSEKEEYDESKITEILNKLTDSELITASKYFETKENSDVEISIRKIYTERNNKIDCEKNLAEKMHLKIDEKILKILPPYSFIIEFEFALEKPYISKGDEKFTIIENSIKREKILGCPYIPGSTWKGCLRSALWQEGKKENNGQINRIFGNERQEKKQNEFHQGRLHFFPTFFSKFSFEVINPHDRKTRAGTMPILIECVPIGEKGKFSLLYVPFDLIGKDHEEIKKQILEDLSIVVEGLEAMFTKYGFGAKTSSGYGIAGNAIIGKLYLDKSIKTQAKVTSVELPENFQKYLNKDGTVKRELINSESGKLLSNSQFQKNKDKHGFSSGKEFSKFRRWYDENGEAYRNSLNIKNSPQNMCEFTSFAELKEITKAIVSMNSQSETPGGNS